MLTASHTDFDQQAEDLTVILTGQPWIPNPSQVCDAWCPHGAGGCGYFRFMGARFYVRGRPDGTAVVVPYSWNYGLAAH